MTNPSLDELIRRMKFRSQDSKLLANLLIFSHDSIIETLEKRIERCEDGIHCNRIEIEKLKEGEFSEQIIARAKRDMLKAVSFFLSILATGVAIIIGLTSLFK